KDEVIRHPLSSWHYRSREGLRPPCALELYLHLSRHVFMTPRPFRHPSQHSMKKRHSRMVLRRKSQRVSDRAMHLEKLEERQLLAVGPRLISVQPNDGSLLSNNEVRHIAPRELTLVFQEGQTIDTATLQQGVRLTRTGFDGVFDNGNDVIVTPGFIGLGDRPNHVVIRFAETLPDDRYRLELFATDQPGVTAIRNTTGDRLTPAVPGTDR